jgi:hypothetical protein
MEALRTHIDRIRFIQVRHEEAAAFAACGYAKFSGCLGGSVLALQRNRGGILAPSKRISVSKAPDKPTADVGGSGALRPGRRLERTCREDHPSLVLGGCAIERRGRDLLSRSPYPPETRWSQAHPVQRDVRTADLRAFAFFGCRFHGSAGRHAPAAAGMR